MDPSSVKRRLTCILAADAVGYSKQMGRDEEGTIRVLSAHRAVIDGIITFHQGRIVGTAGDSVLAEFSSVVEAVRCAVEIQEALKTRNDSLEEHRQMHFRVGVNLGDVVVKNEDLLGDGVNVAARLETMAEPGGICISSSVYDQITGKLDLGFLDIGEQHLKNISRPIHVYRVSGAGATARPTMPPGARPAPRTSRPTPWAAIGAVAVAAIGVAAAWQGGWLRFGPGESPNAVTAVPPVAAPAVDAARAQAEADAQRLRADAEAAKRQAEAELAQARADTEASRAAKAKADADAAANRVRAKAEADAARIRADAEAAAARTKSEADATARERQAQPAKAGQAAVAESAAAAPAVADKSTRATPRDVHRFDGMWNALIECPRQTDGTPAFTIELAVLVKDGVLLGERASEGAPNWFRLQGVIGPGGNAKLEAKGVAGGTRLAAGGAAQGTPYGWSATAHFDGSRGTGRRTQLRVCYLAFLKQ